MPASDGSARARTTAEGPPRIARSLLPRLQEFDPSELTPQEWLDGLTRSLRHNQCPDTQAVDVFLTHLPLSMRAEMSHLQRTSVLNGDSAKAQLECLVAAFLAQNALTPSDQLQHQARLHETRIKPGESVNEFYDRLMRAMRISLNNKAPSREEMQQRLLHGVHAQVRNKYLTMASLNPTAPDTATMKRALEAIYNNDEEMRALRDVNKQAPQALLFRNLTESHVQREEPKHSSPRVKNREVMAELKALRSEFTQQHAAPRTVALPYTTLRVPGSPSRAPRGVRATAAAVQVEPVAPGARTERPRWGPCGHCGGPHTQGEYCRRRNMPEADARHISSPEPTAARRAGVARLLRRAKERRCSQSEV